MATIFQQYDYAKLAAAAYVNFSGVAYADGRLISEAAATKQGIIPLALAKQMFERDPTNNPNPWTVLGAPYNNDAAGFHAVLFGRGTEKVLAIAGTEPGVGGQVDLDLLLADVAQIGTYGVAYAQAVSLINYVLRLTAPAGASNVLQLDLSHRLSPSNEWDPGATGGDPGVTGNYFSVETRYDGTGLGGINAGDLITVTGHSLGGHLAAFARRLFPNIIIEAYTYNAPGFDPATSVKLADEFVALFTAFLPVPPTASFGELNIATYRSDDLAPGNPALVSSWLTGTPPSTPTYITTEQNSHGIGQIVDSLALQSLFSRMDTGFTDAKARALFDAASPDTANSEERLLESLHRVLVGSIDKLPEVKAGADAVFSSDGNFVARTAWYDKFVKVEAAIVARPALQLAYLTTLTAVDLQNAAANPDALATRYALKELNPFAVIGDDSLYSKFNQSGELNLFAADNGKGLSPKWIEDRSSMLYWILLANTADAQVLRRNGITGAWDYEDRNTGKKVGIEQTGVTWSPSQRRKFIFGSDNADTLNGGIQADHLYGAAGTDTLIGNAGDDYLEGGTGDDNLRGGSGNDTYRIDKYSGTDTLIDNTNIGGDGQGRIVCNGQDLTGILTQDGTTRNLYHSAVNEALQIRYIGAEGARGNLVIIDPTPGGSKIILQDWASGELGLSLEGSDATPVTPTPSTHDIIGDPLIHSASIAPGGEGADWRVTATYNQQYLDNPDGSQTLIRYDVDYFRIDADGNPVEGGGPARADTLAGTAANDHIVSGGEGDTITLSLGGSDDIDTGSGDDSVTKYGNGKVTVDLGADADHFYNYGSSGVVTLSAGTGRDYAAGGSEGDLLQGDQDGDILAGGAGDDRLFADSEISLDLAVTQGNSDTGSGQQGDWLTGNAGDDSLVGGSGNDVLSGGGGADLLIGGAGDDDLLGDIDWVATQFEWSVTDRADGRRDFHPTSGTLFPADGGSDVIYAGAGDDHVWAGIGNDLVTGDVGADKLYGEEGNDVLVGGEGDDRLYGEGGNSPENTAGDDYLFGGDGKDTLIGGGGSDFIMGGAGNDELVGDVDDLAVAYHGADTLDGGDGNDSLYGYGGDDSLLGGEGDDFMEGDGGEIGGIVQRDLTGNDFLDGGGGNDRMQGDGGNDTLFGGAGDDILGGDADNAPAASQGNDLLDGGADNDILQGYGGNDTLIGGTGTDILHGGMGDDTYVVALGDAPLGATFVEGITDESGTDTLRFGAGIALANIRPMRVNGSDLLLEIGNDRLGIKNGANGVIERFELADGSSYSYAQFIGRTWREPISLTSGAADATLVGGAQSDTIVATAGRARVSGGAGNDLITVQGSDNAILYTVGDGTDHVTTTATSVSNGNVLRLSGVTADDLRLGLGSLAIQIGADVNDVIHFEYFNRNDVFSQRPFDHVEFDDGSVLDYDELMARGFDHAGGDLADVINGTNVTDRIVGGAGNDNLQGDGGADDLNGGTGADLLGGGAGDDTYYFSRGDGQDQISDWAETPASVNTLKFGPGIALSDLIFDRRADGSLHIGIADTEDGIRLADWYRTGSAVRGIQRIVFDDGASFDPAVLDGLVIGSIKGTPGNDILTATWADETILGYGGDDIINGGLGDDVLMGGAGADSYVFGWETVSYWDQNGTDTIIEADGESSTLLLQRGMSLDLFRAERFDDDLRFRVRGGEHSVLIKDYYTGNQQWSIKSYDGSVTSMSDFLARPDPDSGDLLREAWNDFNSAARWEWNSWHERPGNNWELLSDGRYHRSNSSVSMGATVYVSRSYSTEHRWASDGTMYTVETEPIGGGAWGYAYGSLSLSEDYEGFGSPKPTTSTSAGYFANTRSTTTLSATFTMQWAQSAYDLNSRYYRVPRLVPLNYLLDKDGNFVYTDYGKWIWNEWAEIRVYEDTYRASVGGSVISYSDSLVPGAASVTDAANALKLVLMNAVGGGGTGGPLSPSLPTTVTGTHNVVETTNHLNEYHGTAANEFLYTDIDFAADGGGGDDIIISNHGERSLAFGGDGNDKIFGAHEASDVLNGGRGDDYLAGMGGDDTYLVLRGQTGHDVIDEVVAHYSVPYPGSSWSWTEWNPDVGHGSRDTVRFGPGITLADLKFSHGLMSSQGVDAPATAAFYETLNISWAAGESIHIALPDLSNPATIAKMSANQGESFGIEWFRFDDGTMVSMEAMRQRAADAANQAPAGYGVPQFLGGGISPSVGTDGDEWLYGGSGTPNYLEGNGGNDHLYGNTLRDYLAGGAGNDYLDGGLGADILVGGEGSDMLLGTGGDTLIGGSGNDRLSTSGTGNTFVYQLGDGIDVIAKSGTTSGNSMIFGDGIYSQDISLGLGSLLIRVKGEDAIHIEGFDPLHPYAAPTIDKFVFSDGSVHTYQALLERGFDLSGSDGDDRITGTAISDRLTGGLGNDILAGGAGNDRYIYWIGDDSDHIDDALGNDTLFIGGGISADGLETARTGTDLVIGILGTDDTITLDNWYGLTEGVGRIEFGDGSFLDRSEMESHRNDPPQANPDSFAVHEDGGALNFAAANLLDNDTDPNPGDVLSVVAVGSSQVGATVTLADGRVSYDIADAFQALAENEVLQDSFSYTIADSEGAQATGLVNVAVVGTNDTPITNADVTVAVEDAFALIAGNVLTNDSDIDNGAVLGIAAPGEYVGTYGTLALAADGRYGYALANDGLAVQSLAHGQVAVDYFGYEVTDGIVAVGSALDITVSGVNDVPVAADDAGIVVEDWQTAVSGNLVANDRDVDQGTVLQVANPGTYAGDYGSLELEADGTYTYTLDNASAKIQSLGREAAVVEHFGYTASDGLADASATLDVFLHGTNDAPIVMQALADHDVTFNKPFVWQMPVDSFKDFDTGDALIYSAAQADGSVLPDWLHFDAQMLTFSGTSPKIVMSLDVRVTATDKVAATGSVVDSLSASDVFTLVVSHGNQGLGNGQDAAPAGQMTSFNDGDGTSPGNPGAKANIATAGQATVAAPASEVPLSDAPETGSTALQLTPLAPTYLGLREWAQYGAVAASGTKSIDAASIFARWLAMDLAMSRELAGKSPSWLDDRLGSDVAALNKTATGFLGSTHSFGKDAFSLIAASGQNLQTFKGLGEGLQKIA